MLDVVIDVKRLKQGDIVVCRDWVSHESLTCGKKYRVISVSEYYIHVLGDKGRIDGWKHECWELPGQHRRMPEPDQSLDDILDGQDIYAELERGK